MLLRAKVDRASEDSSLRMQSDIVWSDFRENKSILGKPKTKNHSSSGWLWLWTDGKGAPFTELHGMCVRSILNRMLVDRGPILCGLDALFRTHADVYLTAPGIAGDGD